MSKGRHFSESQKTVRLQAFYFYEYEVLSSIFINIDIFEILETFYTQAIDAAYHAV
jgi:hypothetical protein